MKTSTAKWLTECRARLAAATPGPWCAVRVHAVNETWFRITDKRNRDVLEMVGDCEDKVSRSLDAELIAHAPTDLDRALRIIELYAAALKEAAEYARVDDVNGYAGEIAQEALAAADAIAGGKMSHHYDRCTICGVTEYPHKDTLVDCLRVIEKSAYDQVLKERDALKTLVEFNAKQERCNDWPARIAELEALVTKRDTQMNLAAESCAHAMGRMAAKVAELERAREGHVALAEENTRLRDFVRRVAEFEKQIAASVCPTRPNTRMGEEAEKLLEKK